MSTENKAVVVRYFSEAVDRRNLDLLEELFTSDCVIHRPETSVPITGLQSFRKALTGLLNTYSEFTTDLHDVFAAGDRVACRFSHKAVSSGEWTSRIGRHAVAGKAVHWSAIAIFRIRDGKIAEEWVCRDELGMLITLGVLSRS